MMKKFTKWSFVFAEAVLNHRYGEAFTAAMQMAVEK